MKKPTEPARTQFTGKPGVVTRFGPTGRFTAEENGRWVGLTDTKKETAFPFCNDRADAFRVAASFLKEEGAPEADIERTTMGLLFRRATAPINHTTPGPWQVMTGRTLLHVETSSNGPPPHGVAVCSVPKSHEADARLIAAAPDMFDALQTERISGTDLRLLVAASSCTAEQLRSFDAMADRLDEAIRLSAAALAKARGES